MTSILLVLLALVIYAAMNVIMAHQFSGVSPFVVVPIYSLFVAVATFGLGRVANALGHTMSWPNNTLLMWLLVIGVILVVGDLALVGAYSVKGASMATITTCVALMPVFAAIIEKLCFGGELPSLRTMCGFALAVFTVWIVAFDPANLPIKH